MKFEAKDRKHPSMICVATIKDVSGDRLLVHFDGWDNSYDYWCEPTTHDIHPIRWCQENGIELYAPRGD